MDKLIIKSIEGRIMLGITMFVAIMIMVGWIAINEPGRMASFVDQNKGRSIERGADLFSQYCYTCHGVDGRGVPGNGPALNNPQLFGFDFVGDVNNQIIRDQRELNDLQALDSPTQDDLDKIDKLKTELNGDGSNPGLLAQRDDELKKFGDAMLKGYMPHLQQNKADLEAGNITPLEFSQKLGDDANRLKQVSWNGSLEGYLTTTIIAGRPGSNNVWPNPMVSWSQRGGGPLRDDQIADLVSYVMNFDKGSNWTLDDLNAVNQFARLHKEDTGAVESATQAPTGEGPDKLGPTDCTTKPDCVIGVGTVADIVASLPAGDASHGGDLYNSNGCIGCHGGGVVGPNITGTLARIQSDRLPAQTGTWTAEQFIVASILYPNYYVPDGFPADTMPQTFGQQFTIQDIADIVAFIKTQ